MQLRLQLASPLSYARAGFVLHEGIREVFESCRTLCLAERFSISFIVGGPRSGKTHFAVAIAEELASMGRYPHLVSGAELEGWFREHDSGARLSAAEPVIVDDLQAYLDRIEQSGAFVAFIEGLRHRNVPVLLIGSREIDQYGCDDHVKSRLRAATGERLGHPSESDVPDLIAQISKQRGLKLDDRKLQFLLKRVRRDIPSIEEYVEKVRYLADALGKPVRFPVLGDAL